VAPSSMALSYATRDSWLSARNTKLQSIDGGGRLYALLLSTYGVNNVTAGRRRARCSRFVRAGDKALCASFFNLRAKKSK
jgi:hypothetical protein